MEPTLNSPAKSKINIVNAVSAGVALLAAFGVVIPAEYQQLAMQVIAVGAPIVTIILRTWFTGKKA